MEETTILQAIEKIAKEEIQIHNIFYHVVSCGYIQCDEICVLDEGIFVKNNSLDIEEQLGINEIIYIEK